MPQPTACAVKLAEALEAYGLVRTSCRARLRCSSPPCSIRLLMLSPPARQATRRRCIWAPSNPVLGASFPVARSRAAPAMRETRFNAQRPFEV
jgi:hypothetical protein